MRTFSQIPIPTPASHIDPSPKSAKAYLRSTIAQHLDLCDRSINYWMLRPQETARLDGLIGRRSRRANNCLASNMKLRGKLGCLLIDSFREMMAKHPRRRFYLVTLISDRWLAFDRDTYIWLGGMQNTVRPIMSIGGFDGWFAMLEIQTLDETVRGLGRILLPHAHAVAWSDDPDFDPEKAAVAMKASKRLVSRIGAETVDISYRADTSPCNLAAYLFKAAAVAKFREPCRSSPSGLRLADTALPPVSAVRQSEILSGIYFDELMLAGGDGAYLRAALKRYMRGRIGEARGWETSSEDALATWRRARKNTGRDANYWPVDVIRTDLQLPYESPISLACARFTPPGTIS